MATETAWYPDDAEVQTVKIPISKIPMGEECITTRCTVVLELILGSCQPIARTTVITHVRREGMHLNATERQAAPRYSLLLVCLVCILASMLVAWVGILRPRVGNPGFPETRPRPLAFIEEGKLVHEVTREYSAMSPFEPPFGRRYESH